MSVITPEQQFERILLASLSGNKEIFSKVLGILKPSYFTQERKDIFSMIQHHFKEYSKPPSLGDLEVSIKNIQNQDHRNKIFQELQSLGELDTSKYNTEKICNETLTFVKDALYLQALEIGSEGLLTKDDKLKLKAEQLLDERAKVSIDSDLGIEYSDASAIIDYYGLETHGILTQHYSLNDRLGPGFLPGTLSLFLAPSGVGKSLMMTDIISGLIKAGKNVLLVSLEMSAEEVMKRVHSNVLEIPIADFVPKHFNRDLFIRKLNESKVKGCGTFWAKDFPPNSFGALQLENLVDAFKNEKDIEFDIVFVDYIGIMKSDIVSPSVGLYSYVKSIAEEVRACSKRLGIPIVSASQLNRCFSLDTVIHTTSGDKLARDIKVGDEVISSNGVNVIEYIHPIEKRDAYRITTKSGKSIVVSRDHRIPTERGLTTINHGLCIGDRIDSRI